MYRYRIYGLDLASSRALPGIMRTPQGASAPDMVVDWVAETSAFPDQAFDWQPVSTPELQRRRRVDLWQASAADGLYLHMRYTTRLGSIQFLIGPGARSVGVYWPSSVAFSDIQSYFVGPVFACLLRRRGVLCLHASVVEHGGHAVALIGDKGAGKSTTAAALVRDGWRSVADDVAALRFETNQILVNPGYPRMRLDAMAAETFFGGRGAMSKVYSHVDKHYLELDAGPSSKDFCSGPLPLSAIFFLGARSANGKCRSEAVNQRQGLVRLAKNTIGNYVVIDPAAKARELEQMAGLARRVPLRSLSLPDGIDALSRASGFLRGLSADYSPWPS